MAETNFKWYVLRAISGKESKVKEYIDNEIANSDLGLYVSQVLIPQEKVYTVRNGKKVIKEKTFLPGYVLVEAKLADQCFPRLRNVPNVLGFLGEKNNTVPTPIRPSEINRILGKVDELQDADDALAEPFLKNELVKVTYGPFNGFHGVIDEVMEDKKKLKVTVTIFGRPTPVELSYTQVEKE